MIVNLLVTVAALGAIPDKPDNPQLDPTSAHYADIVSCLPFIETNGLSVSAFAGPDATIRMDSTGSGLWVEGVLNGNAVNDSISSGGADIEFAPTGSDETREYGAILMVVRRHAAESASSNGAIYASGHQTVGGVTKNGTLIFRYYDDGHFQVDTRSLADGRTITYASVDWPHDEWIPIVLTWDAGNYVKAYWSTEGGGEESMTADSTLATGVIVYGDEKEVVLSDAYAQVLPQDAGIFDIAYYLRLNANLNATEISAYLADPFLNLRETPNADTTGPVIALTSASLIYSFPITATGTITDAETDIDPTSVQYGLNGTGSLASVDSTHIETPDGLQFSFSQYLEVLGDGPNTLYISACDTLGNCTTTGLSITYEVGDPPTCAITSPSSSGDVGAEFITITGTSESDNGISDVSVAWTGFDREEGFQGFPATGTTSWSIPNFGPIGPSTSPVSFTITVRSVSGLTGMCSTSGIYYNPTQPEPASNCVNGEFNGTHGKHWCQ